MRNPLSFALLALPIVIALLTAMGCSGGATGSSGTGGAGGSGSGGSLPAGQCRSQQDCAGPQASCVAPGTPMGCGVCVVPPNTCLSDDACLQAGPTSICEPAECACSGQKVCTPGCTGDAECGPAEACTTGHRCEIKACAAAADCPDNFGCTSGHCARKACSTDAECKGTCVLGTCQEQPGYCQEPAA
jgi:hypothetical protein